MDKADVVDGQHYGTGIPQRSEVLDVESVYALACGCLLRALGVPTVWVASRALVVSLWSIGSMTLLPVVLLSSPRIAVPARAARRIVAFALAAMCVDTEVHGMPCTTMAVEHSRESVQSLRSDSISRQSNLEGRPGHMPHQARPTRLEKGRRGLLIGR